MGVKAATVWAEFANEPSSRSRRTESKKKGDAIHPKHDAQDAKGIWQEGRNSVTQFFGSKTREPLTVKFMPAIKQSLEKIGVVNQFNAVASKRTGLGLLDKDTAKLETHVTAKTLDSLYAMIGQEEKKIREIIARAGHALLSRVLGALR